MKAKDALRDSVTRLTALFHGILKTDCLTKEQSEMVYALSLLAKLESLPKKEERRDSSPVRRREYPCAFCMKKYLSTATVLQAVLVLFLAGCQKDTFTPNPNNPPEQMLPQAAVHRHRLRAGARREGEYSDMELDMYPADMRYLKAEVFNGIDHYFSYRIGGSGEKGGKGEKQFWAYIYGNISSYHKYINQY